MLGLMVLKPSCDGLKLSRRISISGTVGLAIEKEMSSISVLSTYNMKTSDFMDNGP